MRTDAQTAEKIGSLYFDENTILEVEQKGGGGAGVAGVAGVTGGLAARNLMTGESTAEVIEEQADTIEEQAGTIETQAATIEEQAAEITELENEIAAFPEITALNVTTNGTYDETGKAYKPVVVNVPAPVVNGLVSTSNPCRINFTITTIAARTLIMPWIDSIYRKWGVALLKIPANTTDGRYTESNALRYMIGTHENNILPCVIYIGPANEWTLTVNSVDSNFITSIVKDGELLIITPNSTAASTTAHADITITFNA